MSKKSPVLTESDLRADQQMLKQARTHIESGAERYICFALFRASSELRSHQQAGPYSVIYDRFEKSRHRVRDWILDMLRVKVGTTPKGRVRYKDYVYLDVWMKNIHLDLVAHLPEHEYRDKMRQTRMAWIDWMLGEIDRELETVRAVVASVPSTARDRRAPANP